MCDRDARVRGRGHGAGHAWHDLEWHTGPDEGQGLLATPTKDKGIAALEPGYSLPCQRSFDQQGVDLVLR